MVSSSFKVPDSIIDPILSYSGLPLYSEESEPTKMYLVSLFAERRTYSEDIAKDADDRSKELGSVHKFYNLYNQHLSYNFDQYKSQTKEHIANSRQLILEAATENRTIRQLTTELNGTAIVFAPGELEPLPALSKIFKKVILVSYDEQLLKQLKGSLPLMS